MHGPITWGGPKPSGCSSKLASVFTAELAGTCVFQPRTRWRPAATPMTGAGRGYLENGETVSQTLPAKMFPAVPFRARWCGKGVGCFRQDLGSGRTERILACHASCKLPSHLAARNLLVRALLSDHGVRTEASGPSAEHRCCRLRRPSRGHPRTRESTNLWDLFNARTATTHRLLRPPLLSRLEFP